MFIDVAPPLSDENAELLEDELDAIADQLGLEGIEIAGCVEDGIELISSFMIYYEDKDDDEELARLAGQVLAEFRRLQSEGQALSKSWERARPKIGTLKLTLDRDGV
jgi:hypothetical protein